MPLDNNGFITAMTMILIVEVGLIGSVIEWKIRRMEKRLTELLSPGDSI